MKEKLACFLLLALLPRPLAAQFDQAGGSIQGRVIKAPGEERLPQSILVTLIASGGQQTTRPVHSSGAFEFNGLKPGNYVVRVESPGYQAVQESVELLSGLQTVGSRFVTIQLGRRLEESEDSLPPADDATRSAQQLSIPPKARQHFRKAEQASAQGRHEKAIQHLLKALRIAPELDWAYNNLSAEYAALGKTAQALEALEKSIQLNPKNALTHRNLGGLYLDSGQPDQALAPLEKSLQLDPDDSQAWFYLGEALYTLKQFERASEAFGKADRGSANPSSYYLYAGNTCLQLQRLEDALKHFSRFLEVAPEAEESDSVRDLVARLKAALKPGRKPQRH